MLLQVFATFPRSMQIVSDTRSQTLIFYLNNYNAQSAVEKLSIKDIEFTKKTTEIKYLIPDENESFIFISQKIYCNQIQTIWRF
ncbi:unnamed protein product [Paramecium sonneborni]|uniref:Uncharacterized protein n=1 Tax=Paramecium sonneborni TaxID=65129 RepID=A0A8S1KQZ6_9CILI|nr:unnamed protein product [Paramecium sonneborni]